MKVTYSLVYNRRNKKLAPTDRTDVQIEAYFSRAVRRWIDTNIKIEPQYWDAKARNISKKHPNFIGLYQLLKSQIENLEAYELQLLNSGRQLTPELLSAYQKGSQDSFLNFAKSVLAEELQRHRIDKDTYDAYQSKLSVLKAANDGADILFSNINEDLIKKIDIYYHQQGQKQTTIGKNHVTIKKFLRAAERKGILDPRHNPYLNFDIDRGESLRVNLEPAELVALEDLDTTLMPEEMAQVLFRFLFSCYTGLRVGDSILLKKDSIKHTDDGFVVDIVTEKGKGAHVVLHLAHLFDGKPQKIAEICIVRYPNNATLFPPMTDQAINRLLKNIAYMAGIKKTLTFHMARHTCGTALAGLTANPYLIMDILGHSDIKTSMIYIHNSAERVRKQLLNVKWNW